MKGWTGWHQHMVAIILQKHRAPVFVLTGSPGFEPGSQAPEARVLSGLYYEPIKHARYNRSGYGGKKIDAVI